MCLSLFKHWRKNIFFNTKIRSIQTNSIHNSAIIFLWFFRKITKKNINYNIYFYCIEKTNRISHQRIIRSHFIVTHIRILHDIKKISSHKNLARQISLRLHIVFITILLVYRRAFIANIIRYHKSRRRECTLVSYILYTWIP